MRKSKPSMNQVALAASRNLKKRITYGQQSSYDDAVRETDQPRMTKVSVTVDRGLLSLVDHYVQAHPGSNRSEIFDRALEMWVKETQKQADMACYGVVAPKSEERTDWTKIQTEGVKDLW